MAKKILIVDDEEDIRTSIQQLVDSLGFDTKTAASGTEALKILKEEKFDLVILDMFMPKMSGRELLEKIRQEEKIANTKVAFLTVAQLNEAGKEKIEQLKPVDYIQKPVDIDELSKKIQKILK